MTSLARKEIQVVEFGLGDDAFAVPVAIVREILDYAPPQHVPNGPPYLLGLTDVRGGGVPTIDFRIRMGLPAISPTLTTRILILDVPLEDRVLTLGLVIDKVMNVCSLDPAMIEQAPDIGVRWDHAYIAGILRRDSGFLVLIDAARIFTSETIHPVEPEVDIVFRRPVGNAA